MYTPAVVTARVITIIKASVDRYPDCLLTEPLRFFFDFIFFVFTRFLLASETRDEAGLDFIWS